MPRMNILNAIEREAFDSPPVFNSFNASSILTSPPNYTDSPLTSAVRPTGLVSTQRTLLQSGEKILLARALSTGGISSM
jgi:hypothetical protein